MVVAAPEVPQYNTVTLLHSVVVNDSQTVATLGVFMRMLVGTPSLVVVAPVRVPVRVTVLPIDRSKGVTAEHWSFGGWAWAMEMIAKESTSSGVRILA